MEPTKAVERTNYQNILRVSTMTGYAVLSQLILGWPCGWLSDPGTQIPILGSWIWGWGVRTTFLLLARSPCPPYESCYGSCGTRLCCPPPSPGSRTSWSMCSLWSFQACRDLYRSKSHWTVSFSRI